MAEKPEIYVVASGKGGVGKSTFVAGVSNALSSLGKRVLAIDCDIGLRSLDLLLECGEKVVFDWGDFILGHCDANQVLIKGDVDFVAAPRFFDDSFNGENLAKLIEKISVGYDFIFMDAPAGIDSGFMTAAGCADNAIVVSTPDRICVRSCSRAFEEIEKLKIENTRLVINMFETRPVHKGKLLNVDECIDETGVQLLGVIPMDRELAFSSVTGITPGEFSVSDQAFYRIAKRLSGERVPLSL